ncbi:phosphoinositide-3-kinase-interacting protein 1 isoform X2 [Denticeps clupeoides]|uniref:Kringle domain-containing protein n=1 Tax=Denticeps clupeoides TaxID=299321 RepID=A0AAY4CHP4_9TELE|nr:phosphoinositide-3-kinase-interacting protein 1-like isoform X2 [Denticeps clupeoides]
MFYSLPSVFIAVAAVGATLVTDECIRSRGVDYRGLRQTSSAGSDCLNWINATRDYDTTVHADAETGVGDHSYCRNPDASDAPWCYVSGPDGDVLRQACAIASCSDQSSAPEGPESPDPSPAPTARLPEIFGPARSVPAQGEVAAVQPVRGGSQWVRTGPKKKKDLGTLGYVLGIIMMAIIILLGVGITLGYFYKRGMDLKKQQEQRRYEREMQRITLPLSAFTNATCELVDENTIVITAEQPSGQDGAITGGDPLLAQAVTPGA